MNQDMRSICFVSPFGYPLLVNRGVGPAGGAERQFFLFGQGLSAKGWRVSFITNLPNYECLEQKPIFPSFQADFSYLGGSKWRMPFNWFSFWSALKKADADFYVLKVPGHLLPLMAAFCRLHRHKLVFWAQMSFDANPHERSFGGLPGLLQDKGIHHADIVIAQNREQQEAFLRNYGIKADLVQSICGSIASGNPITDYRHADILWAGNTHAKKRPEVVLDLAVLMPDLQFVMAMNIGDHSRFEALRIKAEGIPNLQFLGQVPPREMESWFRRVRIFLSTSEREGFPNTFLQAWMNGVPVVSLQIDPDRVIQEKGLGLVVAEEELRLASGDGKAFARYLMPHIRTLLSDETLRQSVGQRVRSYVEENHSSEVVVPRLIETLLMSRSRPAIG